MQAIKLPFSMKNLISFLFFCFEPLAGVEITLMANPTAEERSGLGSAPAEQAGWNSSHQAC